MTDDNKSCGCSSMTHTILMTLAFVAVVGLIFMEATKPAGNMAPQVNPTIQVDTLGMQKDTISVSGNAQISVSPDEAVAYVSVVTDNATAKISQENNRVLSDEVMSSLKRMGINASDIETDSYTLTKLEDFDPYPLPKVEDLGLEKGKYIDRGYRLTNTLKVTTRNIAALGDIIDAAVGAGANGVDRVTFQLSKESEKAIRDQAMVRALQAAKDKAESLAETAGVSLGKVVSIQEQNFYYAPYEFNVRNSMASGDAGLAPTVISPQKVEVTSSVQLIYRIA